MNTHPEITKRCADIVIDMVNDSEHFDGLPFNGLNVGTQFGNHGAAIAANASSIAILLNEIRTLQNIVNGLVCDVEELKL